MRRVDGDGEGHQRRLVNRTTNDERSGRKLLFLPAFWGRGRTVGVRLLAVMNG